MEESGRALRDAQANDDEAVVSLGHPAEPVFIHYSRFTIHLFRHLHGCQYVADDAVGVEAFQLGFGS